MRGKHRRYIAIVNAMTPDWYEKKGGKFITTRELVFDTIAGDYVVKTRTKTDLFSCVPDTGYIRFQMAAVLHDDARKRMPRHVADLMFFLEMCRAIQDIRKALCLTSCPRRVINRECVRLARIAALYMIGVSGVIGSIYIKLDKWF